MWWVSTRSRRSTLVLGLGCGTLALVESHCQIPGVRLLVGVCCPFGLPKMILGLLGEAVRFSYWLVLFGYIANIRFPNGEKKLKPIFFR